MSDQTWGRVLLVTKIHLATDDASVETICRVLSKQADLGSAIQPMSPSDFKDPEFNGPEDGIDFVDYAQWVMRSVDTLMDEGEKDLVSKIQEFIFIKDEDGDFYED